MRERTFLTAISVLIMAVFVFLTSPISVNPVNSSAGGPEAGPAATMTEPLQTFVVTNADASGPGSFAQAITSANDSPGPDAITFNVPGSGIQFFPMMAPLPTVTDPVIIDATTQPGYTGSPLIALTGISNGQALNIASGSCTIRGFSFTSFIGNTSAIITLGGGNNIVTACSFGVLGNNTRSSTTAIGILIDASSNNRIGGSSPAERNYFVEDFGDNLIIRNGATGNHVTGNWFGTGPNGTRMDLVRGNGITITNAPNNTIGGTLGVTPGGACTGECNVISGAVAGAGGNGIFIDGPGASGNRVIGNLLGLFPDGASINRNGFAGVSINNAPDNVIGGATAAQRNVITGSSFSGVDVAGAGATGNIIAGNYIGTFSDGTTTPPTNNSAFYGIQLITGSSETRVGGTGSGERNIISGHRNQNLAINSSDTNTVQGNYIGTDASGMLRSTTAGGGIGLVNANNNIIGGTSGTTLGGACTGACNVISGNGNNGTGDGLSLNASNNNLIDGNYIGLDAAGTHPMLNGITPDGAIFDGKAIRFFNSSNNTVGHDPHPAAARPARPAARRAGAPVCLSSSGPQRSFTVIDLDTRIVTAHHCDSRLEWIVNSSPAVADPGIATTSPVSYLNIGGTSTVYGTTAYSIDGVDDSSYFNFVGHKIASLDEFQLTSGYAENLDPNCGVCPTEGITLVNGPINYGGDQANGSNQIIGISIGLKNDGIRSLGETHFYKAITNESPLSQNNRVDLTSFFAQDNQPIIDMNTGAVLYSGITINTNAARPTQGEAPVDIDNLLDVSFRSLNPTLINMTGRLTAGPADTLLTGELFGVDQRGYSGPELLSREHIVPLGYSFDVHTDNLGTATLDQNITGVKALYLNEWDAIRITLTPVGGTTSEMSKPIPRYRPRFDLDRDGKTDFGIYRAGNGPTEPSYWYTLKSGLGIDIQQFGSGGDIPVSGDYNGDHVPEVAVWKPGNGTWYMAQLGGDPSINFDAVHWGNTGDVPFGGVDFNGDGRDDLTVSRPAEGKWHISFGIDPNDWAARLWGFGNDKKVPADYDGNGTIDLAVVRDDVWYITPCISCPTRYEFFGLGTDTPVPGDYDGDNKADIAVWRAATGTWYVQQSRLGFASYQWGVSGDIPLDGDFDGDGRNDISVYRPADGNWYILQSGTLTPKAVHWGQDGDIPIPSFAARYHF